jgi:hypothetical protein
MLRLAGRFALMMEAASAFETSINVAISKKTVILVLSTVRA